MTRFRLNKQEFKLPEVVMPEEQLLDEDDDNFDEDTESVSSSNSYNR